MDSLHKIAADLASWYFWIMVVLVGLLINLAAAYLKSPLDRWFDGYSSNRRNRTATQRAALDNYAAELANEPSLLLLEVFAELRYSVAALFFLLFTFGCVAIAEGFLRSPDLSLPLLILKVSARVAAFGGLVAGFACVDQAGRRYEALAAAKRFLHAEA